MWVSCRSKPTQKLLAVPSYNDLRAEQDDLRDQRHSTETSPRESRNRLLLHGRNV
jgi:hypothetical protein